MPTIAEILEGSELFRGLAPELLGVVTPLCRGVGFATGEEVFHEGEPADELYVLVSGSVALEMALRPLPDRPAIPTALEVLGPTDCFGWSTLVEPYVYFLTARCTAPCQTLAIRGDRLRERMLGSHPLGYEVMTRLSGMIRGRLEETRLRLTSGLGLALLQREVAPLA